MSASSAVSKFESVGAPQLAGSPAPTCSGNFKFERPDWTLFRQIPTLSQKAGVPSQKLRRLVLKELADNALDVADAVSCGTTVDGYYYVQDNGPGLPPEDVQRLFSINRPLVSSKLWRMPTRGALGNGLRVVAGAVAASDDGELRVTTRNRQLILKPDQDGSTSIVEEVIVDFPVGTRIEIKFGSSMPHDANALAWAQAAIDIHGRGTTYRARTSPHWYNDSTFHELLFAAGDRHVRDLVAEFDGCTGGTAGRITSELKGRTCKSVNHREAVDLLARAKKSSRAVAPRRLGSIGGDAFPDHTYARTETIASFDGADIPAVIEVWGACVQSGVRSSAQVFANRTPITGEVTVWRDGKEICIRGCGLFQSIESGGKAGFDIKVSVIAPYIPITTDGKEPNLSIFSRVIQETVAKALRSARRLSGEDKPASEKTSHKETVLENLADAIAETSGTGTHRFNLRQLFYRIRPLVKEACGSELRYPNFSQIITEFESEHGEIGGMLRDPRGTLYTPHECEEIPLGTKAVENYERTPWTFNKLLYIEKEGFFEILKTARWPERNDCALLTSKGYSTRAVRELIDSLAEHDEPITVFCVHDADSAGSMIFETLQEETAARPRRLIEIVNLGLEPWEAVEMGLDVERFDASDRRRPVARYVEQHEDHTTDWTDWLQTRRVELNAMTTPQFIAWLDQKLAAYDGKIIPPADIIARRLRRRTEEMVEAAIKDAVLRDANIPARVTAALSKIDWPDDVALKAIVQEGLGAAPEQRWANLIDRAADRIAGGAA